MRVNVNYSTTVDDWFRRAIRRYYGRDGLATRQEVVNWFRAYGESMNDEIGYTSEAEAKSAAAAIQVPA